MGCGFDARGEGGVMTFHRTGCIGLIGEFLVVTHRATQEKLGDEYTAGHLFAAFFLAVVLVMTSAIPTYANGQDVLEFESTIKLPDAPTEVAWTHDGKKLAMRGFNDGALHIIDIEKRTVSPSLAGPYKGSANFTFSPDDAYLAVYSPLGLQLLLTADWKEIATVGYDNMRSRNASGHMAFTPDGHTLWMACGRGNSGLKGDSKVDALAFNVPDLKDVGSYEAKGRVSAPLLPNQATVAGRAEFSIVNGRLALTNVISHYNGERKDDSSAVVTTAVRSVFLAENGTHSDEVEFDSEALIPNDGQVEIAIRGRSTLIAVDSTFNTPTNPGLLNIDPVLGQVRIRFGSWQQSRERATYQHTLLGKSPFLIAVAKSIPSNSQHGLLVWNFEIGQLEQDLSAPELYHLTASPPGNRVAGQTLRNELIVYRVLRSQ